MSTLYDEYVNQPYLYQPHEDDERYIISRDGVVRSFAWSKDRFRTMKVHTDKSAIRRPRVTIYGRPALVAHLVATHFAGNPNPEKYKHVINKDGNVNNNHASNLLWVTTSEKNAYEADYGLSDKRRVTFIECIETKETFTSIAEAAEGLDSYHMAIALALATGEPLTCGKRIRSYEGTERVLFWSSDPSKWSKHPKYDNYLVSEDGLVVRLDKDGGLGTPLKNYIHPDGYVWVRTNRKEKLDVLLAQTFGEDK